jgi:hypothetical protein
LGIHSLRPDLAHGYSPSITWTPLAAHIQWVLSDKPIQIKKDSIKMKIKLNPMFEEARGQLGEIVFREVRGATVASRKPTTNGLEPSPEQAEHRERFRQAVAYGKFAMADEATREVYEQAAEGKGTPVFALTVADFLNAPAIGAIDMSAYSGQAGTPIYITTSDDFGVVTVNVTIRNSVGDVLESGSAVESVASSDRWTYTTGAAIPAGTEVHVQVIAIDRPGGTAVETQTKIV